MRRLANMAVLAVVVLAGCGRGTGDLEEWVAEVRQEPAPPIEPIPEINPPEVVSYHGEELRDPFRRYTGEPDEEEEGGGSGEGPRPDPDREPDPLEEFPLDTLAMVGTLNLDGVEYALVRDNERKVHRVREGEYMGRNHGRIEEISANRIVLRELIRDGEGWMEREARIAMDELE